MASNNTSKTAHVMNLLSKNRGPAASEASEVPTPAPASPEAEAPAPVAPILSSINADAAVSSQIKDALEAELEAPPAPKPVPPKAKTPAPEPSQAKVPAPVQEPAAPPVQEPAAPPMPSAEELMDLPLEEPVEGEIWDGKPTYVNVMEELVDEKADKYMEMFGICCCDQCRVDVRAYALNHLPPKYVVMSRGDRIPRLTVYESKYSSDITAQLMKACKAVMTAPHHTREDS